MPNRCYSADSRYGHKADDYKFEQSRRLSTRFSAALKQQTAEWRLHSMTETPRYLHNAQQFLNETVDSTFDDICKKLSLQEIKGITWNIALIDDNKYQQYVLDPYISDDVELQPVEQE